MSASRLESHEPLVPENRRRLQRLRGLISPGLRRDQSAPDYSHRAFTACAVSSWESEEFDEYPHALLLTAARKSLSSRQFGDSMEARPKQFR